jgi:hypothetical protein
VTGYAKLVAVGISEVRAIVVLVIFGPQARRALGSTTVGEGNGVCALYDSVALGQKGHHLTVALLVWPLVIGRTDDKERPRTRV